jgi:hypothetical protein
MYEGRPLEQAAGPQQETAMIHPDIQYQLCRMAHDERVREGLYEQQVVRAALAKSGDDGRTTQPVSRLRRAVAAAVAGALTVNGRQITATTPSSRATRL